MADKNFIAKIALLTGMDKEAVLAKLEELDVNDAMAALDAAGNSNAAEAKRLMSGTTTDEDDESKKDDIDADINPLFQNSPVDSPNDHQTPVEDQEFGEDEIYPNVGDSVITRDGRKGNVKITNGPRNTVGVMIDGKLKMEKRRNLKIEEHVMGMTGVMDLSRMRELAGMGGMTNGGQPQASAADNAMGSLEVPSIEIEIERVPTVDAAECPLQAIKQAAEPISSTGCETVACEESPACMGIDDVMNSFDQIERALPELKVKDAREIRQRVNDLMSKLNESRFRKI